MVTSKIVKISENNIKQHRTAKYMAVKERLLQLFIERASVEKIAEELGVANNTAYNWREWLIEDEGNLVNKKLHRTKMKYIATTLNEIEFVKKKAINMIRNNSDDSKSMTGLINALSGVQRTQLDIMTRFNIIAPESVDVHHFAGEGIEVIFLDENKTKIIEMEEKE